MQQQSYIILTIELRFPKLHVAQIGSKQYWRVKDVLTIVSRIFQTAQYEFGANCQSSDVIKVISVQEINSRFK